MILVTGATGQLGRAVVEHLTKNMGADQVAALVRDEGKAADFKEKGVKLCVGSYDDRASLDRTMQGVEKVLLISGTEKDRVQQHRNVVDAAKRAGVQLLAYTSRVVKDQDVSNPMMASHFETEDYIKNSGLPYTLLRNALYMDLIPLYVGGEKVFETGIRQTTGDGKVSFALRSELGEATANLLAEEGPKSQAYDLTAGEAWSFYGVADALTALSGREVKYTPIERPEFEARMQERGVSEFVIQIFLDFHGEIRKGLLAEVSPEMERLLGRKPASLKDGLKVLFGL